MPIGSADVDDVRNAMRRFDADLRGTSDWQGWEENSAHKFCFREDGRLYPMKQIISMASGTPLSDFSPEAQSLGQEPLMGDWGDQDVGSQPFHSLGRDQSTWRLCERS